MRTRAFVNLAILVLVAGLVVIIWRGFGSTTLQSECTAKVGGQMVTLDPDQAANATLIAAIGVRRELPARAVSIALATAMQESKLHNLDYGDRDSLGLFQQRPSQGWGTAKQVRDPYYATNAFYDVLAKIEGFESMRITDAAQKVQRSAYPQAYQQHAEEARALASAMTGYSAGGAFSCTFLAPENSGSAQATARNLRRAYGSLSLQAGPGGVVTVNLPKGEAGRRLGWSIAAYAVAHADNLRIREITFDSKAWRNGPDSAQGWQAQDAPASTLTIKLS